MPFVSPLPEDSGCLYLVFLKLLFVTAGVKFRLPLNLWFVSAEVLALKVQKSAQQYNKD
jgi:hypothetical protein